MSRSSVFLRRRWPAIALVASLVLNGFLVGIFAADHFKPHRGGFSGERFARFELRRFADRLPQDAVDRIGAALKPLAPDIDARLARLREARAEILRLAAAPEPDRAALHAKLAEVRAEAAAMQEMVQTITYDTLLSLPPGDRSRLADIPDR